MKTIQPKFNLFRFGHNFFFVFLRLSLHFHFAIIRSVGWSFSGCGFYCRDQSKWYENRLNINLCASSIDRKTRATTNKRKKNKQDKKKNEKNSRRTQNNNINRTLLKKKIIHWIVLLNTKREHTFLQKKNPKFVGKYGRNVVFFVLKLLPLHPIKRYIWWLLVIHNCDRESGREWRRIKKRNFSIYKIVGVKVY